MSSTSSYFLTHFVDGSSWVQKPSIILQQEPDHSGSEVLADQQDEGASQEPDESWKEGLESCQGLHHGAQVLHHQVHGDRSVLGEEGIVGHYPHTSSHQETGSHPQQTHRLLQAKL